MAVVGVSRKIWESRASKRPSEKRPEGKAKKGRPSWRQGNWMKKPRWGSGGLFSISCDCEQKKSGERLIEGGKKRSRRGGGLEEFRERFLGEIAKGRWPSVPFLSYRSGKDEKKKSKTRDSQKGVQSGRRDGLVWHRGPGAPRNEVSALYLFGAN